MKHWMITATAVALTAVAFSYAQDEAAQAPAEIAPVTATTESGHKLTSLNERMSYLAGYGLGRELQNQPVTLDDASLLAGIKDGAAGRASALKQEQIQATMKEFQVEAAKRIKAQGKANKKAGQEFMAENAKKEGMKTTQSGLQYQIVKEGDGRAPKATDVVTVNYEGKLLDGTVFDSSYARGKPSTFALNRVIPGWTEGLQLLKEGGEAMFYIPGNLAYGDSPRGPGGPQSLLIFKVELIKVGP